MLRADFLNSGWMFILWKSLPDWHRFEIDGTNKRKVIKFLSWIDIFLNRDMWSLDQLFWMYHPYWKTSPLFSVTILNILHLSSSTDYVSSCQTNRYVLISIFTHQSVGTSCFHWKCQLYIGYLRCSFLWWVDEWSFLCVKFPRMQCQQFLERYS